jgi:quinohemoprotein ethanol dehydrogenase
VHEGNILYRTYCFHCHGFNAAAGSLPDLRYATAEVHKQFSYIVLGGARESRGMPSFKDLLNETQVHAIEAYVLSRSEESAHPAVN